jgi:hypothetical protein
MIFNSFTARCAQGAEIAESWNFSFAVERTAKENHSAAYLQKDKIEEINKNLCALSVSAVIILILSSAFRAPIMLFNS